MIIIVLLFLVALIGGGITLGLWPTLGCVAAAATGIQFRAIIG